MWKSRTMKQADEIVLFFPDVGFILHVLLTGTCCIVNLLSVLSTGGVSSFSLQSIQNVSTNSALFSTVGTFSLIYLSAGWICVGPGALSPCKLHNYSFLQSMLLSTRLIPDLCWSHRVFHKSSHLHFSSFKGAVHHKIPKIHITCRAIYLAIVLV